MTRPASPVRYLAKTAANADRDLTMPKTGRVVLETAAAGLGAESAGWTRRNHREKRGGRHGPEAAPSRGHDDPHDGRIDVLRAASARARHLRWFRQPRRFRARRGSARHG